MLRASPALAALRLSLIPTLSLSSPSNLRRFFTCAPFQRFSPKTLHTARHPLSSFSFDPLLPILCHPRSKGTGSDSIENAEIF
ncbi:hypothetical protein L6164_029241 [Bauhinia variegata]|uniref:Uncharacterized protein n=1 Tax=Bauhinia variegata TaxID=167791 RepID=A0ACB9L869_BAUVA|nr:hypothetical protein L6164_029241 [Bauhinia variegata]